MISFMIFLLCIGIKLPKVVIGDYCREFAFDFLLAKIGYFSVAHMTIATAQISFETLRIVRRSLKTIRKSVQLSAEPCGSHSSIV